MNNDIALASFVLSSVFESVYNRSIAIVMWLTPASFLASSMFRRPAARILVLYPYCL